MRTWLTSVCSIGGRFISRISAALVLVLLSGAAVLARPAEEAAGGEAALKLPDLSQVTFLGIDGHKLLLFGIVICIFACYWRKRPFHEAKNLPGTLHAKS